MDNIKVSVIIPVYNAQKYIKECIDSVLNQTLQDFEIICIDDGSIDNSGLILKEYATKDDRFVLFSQTNQGPSGARNVGINAARGQYVYFLDSDDFIEPDALETVCRELDDKALDIVYFDTTAFGEEGITQEAVEDKNRYYARSFSYPAVLSGEELAYELLKNHDFSCPVWKQVTRRDFLQEHQLCFYNGIIHEDELYTVQTMMLAKRVAYIERVLHHRRLRLGSIMTGSLDFQSVYGYFVCVKELFPFLLERGCNAEKLNQLLMFLRRKTFNARNQFLKLEETEQKEFEKLSEEDKFLFQIGITDYANSIKQRDSISDNNKILLREKESLNNKLSEAQKKLEQLQKYGTARIDIKNYGTQENKVIINSCTDEAARIQSPDWLKNEHGSGVVIHSARKEVDFEIKCCGNGELKLDFRGMDCRDKNGKRYPVWINLTGLNVEGESVFDDSHLVCHDRPFGYNMTVADGQTVQVHLEWQETQDLIAKERETQLKLISQVQQKVADLEIVNAETEKKLGNAEQKVADLEKVNAETEKKLSNAEQKVAGLEKANAETEKKLSNAEQKVAGLEKANAETEKKLGDTRQKVVNLEKERAKTAEKMESLQSNAAKLANELKNVKNGWSFKIGRVVTWIPRTIKDFLKE